MATASRTPPSRGESEADIPGIEIDLLLEGVFRRYGHDFRQYARGSVRRRLARRMLEEGLPTVSALQERVLHDPECMRRLLFDLSINVTAMFRDPDFYLAVRSKLVPLLRTYPFVRVWNAGCSTGEEAYSLAILLEEEQLYDRARIYATDMNDTVVDRARAGIFPLERMREYTESYITAGGARSFSDYYTADERGARFDPDLSRNIIFAQHNLVTDQSFNEFQVILCRNVMIYFDKPLQDRVHELLYESLVRLGVLALGHRESIRFSPFEQSYEELDGEQKLYRRVA